MTTKQTVLKVCPHAHRCIHPCDEDECFLETIEQPNGPLIKITKEQCDEYEARLKEYIDALPPQTCNASVDEVDPISVPCPDCKAKIGERCCDEYVGVFQYTHHSIRIEAANNPVSSE